MIFFYAFTSFIVLQRLVELTIAKRNEKWIKSRGAIEFGQAHYPIIVLMHGGFLIAFILEVTIFNRQLSPFWQIFLFIFIIAQAVRIWVLASLGRFWNTKIIVLPEAGPVKKGPYRFLKHPNYIVVSIEILIIPLLFNAYSTAILFTLLNIAILAIRIPAEERALAQFTCYKSGFQLSKNINQKN
jgi:methyltransferase